MPSPTGARLDEITLIKQVLEIGVPTLGFCLGAQLIGTALGAETVPSPNKEVGVFPIELTDDGKKDPIFANVPTRFPVAHWHGDLPGLTDDAVVLAASDGCPRQVVRYSPTAYGFQCHPEMTRENIQMIIDHCPEDLAPGKYIQTAEEILSSDYHLAP